MRLRSQNRLERELSEILASSDGPLSVDQIVHRLYERDARLSELLVLSGASFRRKQRLRGRVEQALASLKAPARGARSWRSPWRSLSLACLVLSVLVAALVAVAAA